MKVIDLGWSVARLDIVKEQLTILSPSEIGECGYQPSESVTVFGREALLALRDALNNVYPLCKDH